MAVALVAALVTFRVWRHGSVAEVGAGVPAASSGPDWTPAEADWPCWRGPSGSNRTDARMPLRWDGTAGVSWRVKLPGRGHASAVVCGERLFATSADEASATQTLYCLHAGTGERLWERTTLTGGWMALHHKNTHASSTPACDGRRVFVAGIAHGGLWVTAVGVDGEVAWQRRVGPFTSQHGYGSSVALYRGLVIVSGENRGTGVSRLGGVSSYLAALSRETGEVVWLVRRPTLHNYGTPAVVGRQVVLAGARAIGFYDALTGRLDGEHTWDEGRTASTPASGGGRVFVSRTLPAPRVVALTSGTRAPSWEQASGAADVPAPVWDAGRLFLLTDQGILSCLDDASGETRWKLRLGGAFAASPLVADGHLYCTSEQGVTSVVRPGEGGGKVVARCPLGEPVLATPTPARGRLYFRTETGVACVGADRVGRAD